MFYLIIYSLSLYDPELFEPFYVEKKLVIKEDEFSSPYLQIDEFKKLVTDRSMDTSNISFEFFKGESCFLLRF